MLYGPMEKWQQIFRMNALQMVYDCFMQISVGR